MQVPRHPHQRTHPQIPRAKPRWSHPPPTLLSHEPHSPTSFTNRTSWSGATETSVNNQPYGIPQGQWPPIMTPWWFHLTKLSCRNALRKQKILSIQAQGLEHLQNTIDAKHGVLLTPNHSFHWDSYCLIAAAEKLGMPFYIMTAWQVFATSSWFQRLSMQRCGCSDADYVRRTRSTKRLRKTSCRDTLLKRSKVCVQACDLRWGAIIQKPGWHQ